MGVKKAFAAKFMAAPGKALELAKLDPRDDSAFEDKEKAKAQLLADAEAIDRLQDRLFAEGKRALLVVLQGIDCSGKDGTVRAVFNCCGPLGVSVKSFKVPSEEERAHDYLWRVHHACPPRGIIGIFNRSHYEDVLVVKVEKFASPEAIERRYEEINQFEKLVSNAGTKILKLCCIFPKRNRRSVCGSALMTQPSNGNSNPATWKHGPSGISIWRPMKWR